MQLFGTYGFLFFTGGFYILLAFTHILMALAVQRDARWLSARAPGRTTFLFGSNVWALVVLTAGVFGLLTYWIIHYSALRPGEPTQNQNRSDD